MKKIKKSLPKKAEVKIVTLYNHKGGVSKTSTTFNLAHYLADEGKKVLVVDADPQCNLTEIMMAKKISILDKKSEKMGKITELPGTSLLDALKPRIQGDIPSIDIEKVKDIEINKNLFLIRGDVDLSSIEDSLAEAHSQRFSNKIHEKRTYVAIGDFLRRYGKKKKFDFIFLDVGPSSGALTRSCFLACDAFFIPVAPDRFNVQAISTLSKIIERWMSEHQQIIEDFKKLSLPISHGKPKFLGVIQQFFKRYKGKPKPGYQLWMNRIPSSIFENLIPSLNRVSEDLTRSIKTSNVIVTSIPDFASLAPCMQEAGKAVFQIENEDTALISENDKPWVGVAWKDALERMQDYKGKFRELSERLNWLLK